MPGRGVPDSVAVPFSLSTKVTPAGKVPVSLIPGVGLPVAVTVKVRNLPAVNEAVLALVIAGGVCSDTVTVWITGGAVEWTVRARAGSGQAPPAKSAASVPIVSKTTHRIRRRIIVAPCHATTSTITEVALIVPLE